MSHTAVKAVLDHSQAKGAVRLVALVYADAVKEKDVKLGRPWTAWPSQRRVAERAVIAERTVRHALAELCALGEMRRTGELKGRGAVVYDLLPNAPEREVDPAMGCLSGNGLPDEDSQKREARQSALRQSAAPIRQRVASQSGNGLPKNKKGTRTSEQEGVFSDSDSGIEAGVAGVPSTAELRGFEGNGRGGDFEPDQLVTSMRERFGGSG